MNRPITAAIMSGTLLGFFMLGIALDVQAATVIDMFELKATGKEWCKDNPKFFENFNVKVAENITVTITRDVNDDGDFTDIQAKINNSGDDDLNAITMNGRIFPRNKSGSKAEFVLSGVNLGNLDHFFTIRGQATFDKFGNLTKATGTFVNQITGTYTTDKKTGAQSGPAECFDSGTFVTGKKILVP